MLLLELRKVYLDAPGRLLDGRYELRSIAGKGGMATVWRATMRGAAGFCREVAVKRILPSLARDKQFVRMFVEEARIGSSLLHPNIVAVLDFAQDEDGYFLVMEWVDGMDLATFAKSYTERDETTPWWLVAAAGIEVCRALGSAHERRDEDGDPSPVFHRDVDPRNVLVASNGAVKLTDFGLARATDGVRLTQPGMVKGKVGYVAPEILQSIPASGASDIYGAGIVLWEALSGENLFDGKTDHEVLLQVRAGEVRPIEALRPDVPHELADIVHRALAFDPADRWQSAAAMGRALAALLRATPERSDSAAMARALRRARKRKRQRLDDTDRQRIADALLPPRISATAIPLTRRK